MDRDPTSYCLEKHVNNSTYNFHDCMCQFDYSFARNRVKGLKIKHCHAAAEMMKMGNFYTYIIIGVVVLFLFVGLLAAACSCKWYIETKRNPCTCCSFFCCCNKQRKKKKRTHENQTVNVFEHSETGHTWSPINLPPSREGETIPTTPTDESRDPSICMNFCLSDPVQDCCEFFDCDIMWRKKSIYTIPIFGRKKQMHHLQRRPTRPAPLPPKAVVLPQIKNLDAMMYEDECEPVPEAPPSPEPVRTMHPKAMYVDPLAFLQKTFAKNVQDEKSDFDEGDGKPEAFYNKFKNIVMSKVKKSVSMASINKLGISSNPNGISCDPSGSAVNKKLKTASLASLHNLDDSHLDVSYGSKRSLSLASLNMLQEQGQSSNPMLDPRSRMSVMSSVSSATDDIPPSARKDEYIDLEEMSKRIEAKMLAARSLGVAPVPSPHPPIDHSVVVQPSSIGYTPNFIPASAFIGSFNPVHPAHITEMQRIPPEIYSIESAQNVHYFPAVPASQGKPAVPARTTVGAPIYSMSPSGTMVRSKPIVPPRPPTGDACRPPASPLPSTLPRSPRLVKPSGPPPPPPGSKIPIESSI